MDFYTNEFQAVLFHTLILHHCMQENLELKVVSFLLPVAMRIVCI